MKAILVILLFAISISASAQKVKLNNEIYYVDGEPYMHSTFVFKKNEVANFTSPNRQVVYFKAAAQIDRRSVNGYDQMVRYAKLYFNNEHDILYSAHSTLHIVKEIYKCGCMDAKGEVDIEKLLKYSKAFKVSPPWY